MVWRCCRGWSPAHGAPGPISGRASDGPVGSPLGADRGEPSEGRRIPQPPGQAPALPVDGQGLAPGGFVACRWLKTTAPICPRRPDWPRPTLLPTLGLAGGCQAGSARIPWDLGPFSGHPGALRQPPLSGPRIDQSPGWRRPHGQLARHLAGALPGHPSGPSGFGSFPAAAGGRLAPMAGLGPGPIRAGQGYRPSRDRQSW